MIRKAALLIILLLGLAGCTAAQNFYDSPTPGLFPLPDGGAVQLFYSNPNFDPNLNDTLPHYDKNGGEPTVTGGIGVMGVWHF